MKIRNGLVSNSSSSSFLLFLDKVPKTIEETKEMFFPNENTFDNPYPDQSSCISEWPIEKVAKTIFEDIKDQDSLTEEAILNELSHGWLKQTQPSWDPCEEENQITYPPDGHTKEELDAWNDKCEELWNKYEAERIELARKYLKTFPTKLVTLLIQYSDSDGDYFAALEHGDTFRNVQHICISHH